MSLLNGLALIVVNVILSLDDLFSLSSTFTFLIFCNYGNLFLIYSGISISYIFSDYYYYYYIGSFLSYLKGLGLREMDLER